MGRLRHAALHVEEEHGLRRGSPLLCQPEVRGRASAVRPFLPNEVNVGVVAVRGPVPAEVFEEAFPRLELVLLEVARRKREAVVDSGYEPGFRAGLVDEPLGDLHSAPVPVGTIGGLGRANGSWLLATRSGVDLQPRRARDRRLPALV